MNTTNITSIIISAIIGGLVGFLIAKIYFLIQTKKNRQDAVQRSRSVVLGNVHEKIAPLLPDFPYHYKDLVFLGKGIDYLVFDGLSNGLLKKIVFLEIKTGQSTLNKNEQQIKQCINQQRVEYQIRKKQ